MSRTVACIGKLILGLSLVVAVTGCPDKRVAIVADSDVLDFGGDQSELELRITKSATSRVMPPVVVRSDFPGVAILDCDDPGDGCISNGPIDPIVVRIKVDRSMMNLGRNEGVISVTGEGLVSVYVDVKVLAPVVAGMTIGNQAPLANDPVEFADASRVASGWEIVEWQWKFGEDRDNDGTLDINSTRSDPAPYSYRAGATFTASLTVTATDGTTSIEETAERFVVVTDRVGPQADFDVSATDVPVFTPVEFFDRSIPGTSSITEWEWDFGDGGTSPDQNTAHTYSRGGLFTVSLEVTTPDGTNVLRREELIRVSATPPVAAFTVDVQAPVLGTEVQFTDQSVAGTANIANWDWDFGDGLISSLQNPPHKYEDPGTYTVRLTVTSDHGADSETKLNYISVVTVAPLADFDANTRRPVAGDPVRFFDRSVAGTADIDSWSWAFGDGGISLDENPAPHVYTAPGTYEVRLTVTSIYGADTETRTGFITVFGPTPLDAYVREPDPSYSYSSPLTTNFPGYRLHVSQLRSQRWRTASDVNDPLWKHWLTVIEPTSVLHSTALLFITGGNIYDTRPTGTEEEIASLAALADLTGSVVAIVEQVPNEPVVFAGGGGSRSEDALIAHTFAEFMDSFDAGAVDNEWPALLPMTKAAVRAMDAVQTLLDDDRNSGKVVIRDFVVAGESNRGWTAWLAAATDPRVKAIAPIAFDNLNMRAQLEHHVRVYGGYSEALADFAGAGVLDRLDDPSGAALLAIVDPFAYRARFATVSKLIVNSTGDQFYVPDSGQFYFEELPGEKKFAYVPNTDHDLDVDLGQALVPWYSSVLDGVGLPQFEWEFAGDRLTVTPAVPATTARVWFASSPNRDFRLDDELNEFAPPVWSSLVLTPNGSGQYVHTVPTGDSAPPPWTGFFIQLAFAGDIGPQVFSTGVFVSPDQFPVRTPPVADFTVDNNAPIAGTAVQFTDLSIDGTARISTWSWDFGDGKSSTLENPLHVYVDPGTYDVRLTVTTNHGSDSETKNDFVSVTSVPPSAAFDAGTQRPLAGDPVQFTDVSDSGSATIASWAWDFGDGGIDSEKDPVHVYTDPGEYEVSLRVTSAHGTDTEIRAGFVTVFAPTALDAYIRKPDPSYSYSFVTTVSNIPGAPGVRAHVIDMHSQEWRTEDEVNEPGWDHWVTIIEPASVVQSTALLFITGGSIYSQPASAAEIAALVPLASLTGSIIASIEEVPNQPLVFAGENFSRSEDAIIAHTFAEFMDSFDRGEPDNEWPALLPMTKAAVRAMDTVQTFLDDDRGSNKVVVDDFVVAGASKRGWTTWLTGAADTRVRAIAPLVFDALNMGPQFEHHFNVYGGYSEAVADYVEEGIFDRMSTAAGEALRAIVDPYEFRGRFATVPKLMINSSGDQFFVPDSGQFYFDDLPGEKKFAYLPNTHHGLDADGVLRALVPWYISILQGIDMPQFSWEFSGNSLIVTPSVPASVARVWFATSQNRDFRFDANLNPSPPVWASQSLVANGLGQYVFTAPTDNSAPPPWIGFFVQLEFPSGLIYPYKFTTEIRVVPDVYPDHGAR